MCERSQTLCTVCQLCSCTHVLYLYCEVTADVHIGYDLDDVAYYECTDERMTVFVLLLGELETWENCFDCGACDIWCQWLDPDRGLSTA